VSFRYNLKQRFMPFVPIMPGFAAFLLMTGGKILWPTYTDWLMEGDAAQHWLGWQFFRHSPLFQWPIGANLDFGMDIGSSIVFTDSIPLLAFIFKPLNSFLPDRFQYIGLWILICFSLQSYFAWKLLGLFTQHKWLQLIGSAFFVLAPVCLCRAGGHHALFGQWVLLAGLYFYFSEKFSILRWISLQVIVALIHAYLLVMVLAIFSADLIQRRLLQEINAVRIFGYFFVVSVIIAVVMWATGYFILGAGVEIGGVGSCYMNLLSMIDSNHIWSKLLPALKKGVDNNEGFNYLGSGMIGLGLLAGCVLLCRPRMEINVKKIVPILLMSIGLFIYAISNHVVIGTHEIFSYNLPSIIKHIGSTFRCSGRLFWPVYYLIYLSIFYLLFTRLRFATVSALCTILLFCQIIDSTDALLKIRNIFIHSPVWSSALRSGIWSDMARQYKKIIFVPPHNAVSGWLDLSEFAATNRMAINIGYFARTSLDKEYEAGERIVTSILNNELSPDSLYIFEGNALWQLASSRISPSDVTGVADGFRIVAPDFRNSITSTRDATANVSVDPIRDLECPTGRIDFTSDGNSQKYLIYGWSVPESWGTWSDGDNAWLVLNVSNLPEDDVKLLIKGHAFLPDQLPSQEIDIMVNSQYAATLRYDQRSNDMVRTVKLPKRLAWEQGGLLLVKFNFKNAKSPAELSVSDDNRRMGLGFVSLEFRQAN